MKFDTALLNRRHRNLHAPHPLYAYTRPTLLTDFLTGWYELSGTKVSAFSSLPSISIARASTGYAQTAAGVWTPFASGAARITDRGLLVEGATTAYGNASLAGAAVGVIGSGGALPTGWSMGNVAGITKEIVAIGTTDEGLPYIDIRVFGTNTSGAIGYPDLYMVPASQATAANGQTWTASVYIGGVAGSRSGFVSTNQGVNLPEFNAGSYLANTTDSVITSTWRRSIATRTLNNGATNCVRMAMSLAIAIAGVVDYTFRVAAPQLEQSGFASSPVIGGNGGTARAADVISLPVSGLAYPVTMYAEFEPATASVAATRALLYVDAGTSPNDEAYLALFSGGPFMESKNSTILQAQISPAGTVTLGSTARLAGRVSTNNVQASFNGTLGAQDSSATNPTTPTRVLFGGRGSGAQGHAYLRRLAIWPTAFSDASLQSVTGA